MVQLLYAVTAGRSCFNALICELKRRKGEILGLQEVAVDGCEYRTKFDFWWSFCFAGDSGEFFSLLCSTHCKCAFVAALQYQRWRWWWRVLYSNDHLCRCCFCCSTASGRFPSIRDLTKFFCSLFLPLSAASYAAAFIRVLCSL